MKGNFKMRKNIKNHSSTILSCIGAIGVIATAVLAANETPKAITLIKENSRRNHDGDPYASTKAEAIKSCWYCYIPSAVVGLATISCIFSANILNKRQQASIASAYALLDSSYKEYKKNLKDLYGEEAHQKIIDSIAKEKCKDIHLYSQGIFGYSSLDVEESPEATMLFYDYYSKRYFESTLAKVIQAEYHLNRNFSMEGAYTVNEFYEFLGLEPINGGDIVGWDICSGINWIDFDHRVTKLEDGLECCVIEMDFDPCMIENFNEI